MLHIIMRRKKLFFYKQCELNFQTSIQKLIDEISIKSTYFQNERVKKCINYISKKSVRNDVIQGIYKILMFFLIYYKLM